MSRYFTLNEQLEPEPCDDVMAWGAWFQNADATRIVAHDTPRVGVSVSTVFLGLDHSFGRGEPLLFETMIFGGDHDQHQERYATRAQAVEGHANAVKLAKGDQP